MVRKRRRRASAFDIVNTVIMLLVIVTTLYPFWYCLIMSFSRWDTGTGFRLWPNGFTLNAYKLLFEDRIVWRAYGNTVLRTLLGTSLGLVFTALTAYPLSKLTLPFNSFLTNFVLFTMLFSGGLIPSYLLIYNLRLMDTIWALVLPNLVGAYNVFIMRNFFRSIPQSLEESAMLDGCGWFGILWRIVVPLSKPVMATVGLWLAVMHWNSYYDAMLYIRTDEKTVLQVILRRIAVERTSTTTAAMMANISQGARFPSRTLETAMIVVALVPMLAVYPFIQKYFVKGIMVGSVKG